MPINRGQQQSVVVIADIRRASHEVQTELAKYLKAVEERLLEHIICMLRVLGKNENHVMM